MKNLLPIHWLILFLFMLSGGAIFSREGWDLFAWLQYVSNFAVIFFTSRFASFLLQWLFKVPPARTADRIVTALILFLLFNPLFSIWFFALLGAGAEVAQRLIRTGSGPFFNPAGFAAWLVGWTGISLDWWGIDFPPYVSLPLINTEASIVFFLTVLWAGFVAYRYQKLPIALSFLIAFSTVHLIFLGNNPFPLIFDGFLAFFLLVMVVEPKTSPTATKDQYYYGAIAGGLLPVLIALGWINAALWTLLFANLYTARKFLLSQIRGGGCPLSPS